MTMTLSDKPPIADPAPASVAPAARRDRIPLGIAYMIGASVLFTVTSALSKWLVETYPIGEVLFTRSATALIAFSLIALPQFGLGILRTRKLGQHAIRGVSQSASQAFILIAFSLMPLAGAVAINFSAPLFATLISAVILREAVGAARWAALLVGFAGVLIVARPGADAVQIGALFALMNAILYGSVTVGVRGMTSTESTQTLMMYQMAFLSGVFALLLPFGFVMPTGIDALWHIVNGLVMLLAQYWWTRSLHLAPTSAVVPFNYSSLVWALIAGYLVWGEVPTLWLIAGSAVVVGSGLFLLWRETANARLERSPA